MAMRWSANANEAPLVCVEDAYLPRRRGAYCWLAVAFATAPPITPPCRLAGRCLRHQAFIALLASARPATTAGAAAGTIVVEEMVMVLRISLS